MMTSSHKCRDLLLLVSTALQLCGCSSYACSAVATCIGGVTFQLEPAVEFRHQVEVTMSNGDKRYIGTATRSDSEGLLRLSIEDVPDAGAATLRSISLTLHTPDTIQYQIVADKLTVAEGTVTPRYERVTKGEGECAESCSQARVTIAVSQ